MKDIIDSEIASFEARMAGEPVLIEDINKTINLLGGRTVDRDIEPVMAYYYIMLLMLRSRRLDDKKYTMDQIKKAYFADAHESGEIFFDHLGTPEENEACTNRFFEDFKECLLQQE